MNAVLIEANQAEQRDNQQGKCIAFVDRDRGGPGNQQKDVNEGERAGEDAKLIPGDSRCGELRRF